MPPAKEPLPIVIAGHIDHGKSTLIGRLLYETGTLAAEQLAAIRQLEGPEMAAYPFAHLLDHFQEEREEGITIDTTQRFFRSPNRDYLIIDAPGHRELLKNMVTGASNAKAGILIVDAERGMEAQTRQHGYLLHMIGIREVVALINKMDLVDYRQRRFDEVAGEVRDFLAGLGITPQQTIPISAQLGENLVERAGSMPWYQGPTVVESLDAIVVAGPSEQGLRLPIQDVYDFVSGEMLAVGRIESGLLKTGARLTALPQNHQVRVSSIMKYKQPLQEAGRGECIAFTVDLPEELRRGVILTDGEPPAVRERIECKIFWLAEQPCTPGADLVLKCATQQVPGRLARIIRCFDPADLSREDGSTSEIQQGQVAEVEITLQAPIVTDAFEVAPELGRVVLEINSEPVAGGIIPL